MEGSTLLRTWDRVVAPYRAVARELGYGLLDTMHMDWKTSHSCIDLWHRGGTYLDLAGSIVLEGQPKGIAPGFNFAQFRTFTRDHHALREIYTAAVPDPLPRAFGFNAWITQTIVLPLLRWLPGEADGIPMKQPAALAIADQRHRERVGNATPIVGADPLALRWSLQEELEARSDDT